MSFSLVRIFLYSVLLKCRFVAQLDVKMEFLNADLKDEVLGNIASRRARRDFRRL